MDALSERIWTKVTESLNTQISQIVDYAGAAIVFMILLIFAYIIGWLASKIIYRMLKIRKTGGCCDKIRRHAVQNVG